MTIIEQSLTPKDPTKRSEDGIVVTDDFIAVIDGSTSKSKLRCHFDLSLRSHSNGELAMLIISRYIRRMPKDSSCRQFCTGATKAIRDRYNKSLLPHLSEHPEDRLTASVIVFSRLRRELWLVGDCQALLADNSELKAENSVLNSQLIDNPKPYEQKLAQERAGLILSSTAYQEWLAKGRGPLTPDLLAAADAARQAIIPHMLQYMQQQNLSYSVLDGFPVAKSKVRILPIDFQPHQLVLASDGYPFLCSTLVESEARLALQRQQDPLNVGPAFMATKAFLPGNNSFDDRAYIRFEI